MSEWIKTTVGDCFILGKAKAIPTELDPATPYVGMEHMIPGTRRIRSFGTASEVTSLVSKFAPGDVLFGRLRPYLRKVALAESEGVCSPEVLVLRPTAIVIPEYLYYVSASEACIQHAVDRSAGSRMPRAAAADIGSFEFALPPLPDQHRVVAVMAAVDTQIEALQREVRAANSLTNRVLSATMDNLVGRVTYRTLAATRSGPSWVASDESKTPVEGSTRVVKITNTKSHGTLDMSDSTYVAGLPKSTPRLDERSLIIVRTNGNRDRIGNVYRATPQAYGCAVSAFQFIAQVSVSLDRDFLYWALREPAMQKRMSDAASGSTGLGNLAVKWLNAVEIPWTDNVGERSVIVARLNAADAAAGALAAELAALRAVRTDLLTALLSQDIPVDEAVDKFVKVA
jgi:type I restriction enzyme S subunit